MNSSIINIGVYQVLLNRVIGQGWHSTTYQCIHIQQIQKQLVAKIYQNSTIPVDAEILKLKQLNHPNIVQIYEVFQNEKDVIVIMEKCQSSLKNELKLKKDYDEMELLSLLGQILKGYNYLNNEGLEINELKPTIVYLQISMTIIL